LQTFAGVFLVVDDEHAWNHAAIHTTGAERVKPRADPGATDIRLSLGFANLDTMKPPRRTRPTATDRRELPGKLRLPVAPRSIQKGSTLKTLLDREAIDCLAHNLALAWPEFDAASFRRAATDGLDPLTIMQRGQHLARALHVSLPADFASAAAVLERSLTPPLDETDELGLGVFFYLPHVCFASIYGHDVAHNGGRDPFEPAMRLQYELTRRFSAEFSIRSFLIRSPERTLARLHVWTRDADAHVRRLCSEGSRPRLPWAQRIPAFIKDPTPVLPILEALKGDPDLYVRRSVANHLGDIAKDHPALAFGLCDTWLENASAERKWLIRHAVRHPFKHGHPDAVRLRRLAR
jgi:3-methyladenine DNA glycosylase AlkC